jgi:hypothetical protein
MNLTEARITRAYQCSRKHPVSPGLAVGEKRAMQPIYNTKLNLGAVPW